MRILILLVIAAAAGAIGASMLMSTLQQRDAAARGTMNLLQHHLSTLRNAVQADACTPAQTAFNKAALTVISADIEPVIYQTGAADPPFVEFDQRLRGAIDSIPDEQPTCASIKVPLDAIAAACDACHQQYR